jgi:hypothetical protein
MLISKEQFCTYIDIYKNTLSYLNHLYDAKIDVMDDNPIWKLLDSTYELLNTAVYDYVPWDKRNEVWNSVSGSDLSYWMLELECGERLKIDPTFWTDARGNTIPARNAEEMYDYLLKEQEKYLYDKYN